MVVCIIVVVCPEVVGIVIALSVDVVLSSGFYDEKKDIDDSRCKNLVGLFKTMTERFLLKQKKYWESGEGNMTDIT